MAASQNIVAGTILAAAVVAVAGVTALSSADAGNAADAGTLTLDGATPVLDGAQDGTYRAVCIAAAANGVTFEVFDPLGAAIANFGRDTSGTAWQQKTSEKETRSVNGRGCPCAWLAFGSDIPRRDRYDRDGRILGIGPALFIRGETDALKSAVDADARASPICSSGLSYCTRRSGSL